MEKYAVDLDKVLDELEFNEDRAEQLASALSKRTANGTAHIGYGPATRKSSAPSMHYRRPAFEPINLADADFAAAPQPSASYVESSYTPQGSTNRENRHSASHWKQNGVSTPNIGSMFSSLNEFVGDNKNDLKNHSPSLWIQNNLADGKNTNKGKSEKRNGSLDVFISNKTLNSGGHVSECDTTDGLYYNEISKSVETIGKSDISGKQDIKMKRNLNTGIPESSMYEEYLSKNSKRSETVGGTPSIVRGLCDTNTDGLTCQTSESSVMGIDISCEAEGLGCNSSNLCKEQSSTNYVRVIKNNISETEVSGLKKIPEGGHGTGIKPKVSNIEGKLPANNADKDVGTKLSVNEADVSICNSPTSMTVTRDVPGESSEAQSVAAAVPPVIGFTSFSDISDEELQQYLQELEEEVGNEMDSLAAGTIEVQESITGDGSAHAAFAPAAQKVQGDIPESDGRREDEHERIITSEGVNVSNTAKINDHVPEVEKTSDSSQVIISDVSIKPVDTGSQLSERPAAVSDPSVALPVSVPLEAPVASQESITSTASQNSASTLSQSAVTVPLPNTTPSASGLPQSQPEVLLQNTTPAPNVMLPKTTPEMPQSVPDVPLPNSTSLGLLPVENCDVPDKDMSQRDEGEQVVLSSEDKNLVPAVNSVLANVSSSKPALSVVDPVLENAGISADLAQCESSNTNVAVTEEGSSASSGTTRVQPITSTAQSFQDSELPPSTVMEPQHSSAYAIGEVLADAISSSSETVSDVASTGERLSSTENSFPATSDVTVSGLEEKLVQDSLPGNEHPPYSDPASKEHCSLGEVERTLNDGTAQLLLEAAAASPPSYQSVIDASNFDSLGDRNNGFSQEVNQFPRSEVNVCAVKTPEEDSSIDVLGEEERPSRPHFLHLPSKINLGDQNVDTASLESPPAMLTYGPPGETPSANPRLSLCDNPGSEGTVSSPDLSDTSSVEQAPSDSPSDAVSPGDHALGRLPPYWVPDADAPSCMLCDLRFTVIKRRHHCRACGKVLCSKCCNLKSRLEYLDNAEARVCQPCFEVLARASAVEPCESVAGSPSSAREAGAAPGRRPNPNNPMEYCSTVPPLEQAAGTLRQPPPSVLVPVGVLKREGSARSKSDVAKQVMFSDGIRPGGDLTELDGSSEPRMPYRRPGRVLKRVGTPPGLPVGVPSHPAQLRVQPILDPKTNSFISEKGLPPVVTLLNGDVQYEEDFESMENLMAVIKSETELPVVFAINRNFFVQVKILNLDCCVNRTCWCFSTLGLRCVGQDEVLVILECQPGEAAVPRDVFLHLNGLYQEASRGVTVGELGYTVVQRSNFLGSLDHGGFIYVRPSFQCLHKLVLPPAPYLVAVLIHRWETPWARLFPIRLMLRLGAEFRYYPCLLVSIRQRKPVYCEIGHTIMNLLADFRNLSYTLPSVRGLVIHMEDRQTSILLPKNRYDQVMRALNNSNDHVLAFAANFSQQADSHLVCIQGTEDESYHTQAINIHTKPRKVTGASFVVFNGALKSSLNLTAKSSIVEDGLMVQITADDMVALRTALRNMTDYTIGCGPSGAPAPDELVLVKWVADDKNFNVGVRSSIDGKCLDGVPSIRVHNGTDYVGSSRFIRWTEVFIIQSEDGSGHSGDPLDISRLSESIAQATCLALVPMLDSLAQAGLTMLAVRANIHPDSVGYEAGSGGETLAPVYMNSLDNELVPVLHKAVSSASDSPPAVLELVFHVMLQ
ncbi:zinc finger FYVE domain-containing protein 9 [Bacillus rossius redtenbacheri]|uniref:zinc finger FYVE domain-containing protein 9 n=1 Tax=Bacillus rossius redtenbacheri TaxID=93214 RepID=UPI002FDCB855